MQDEEYEAEIEHAVKLARCLMVDDPDTFKAGYSIKNAALAAEEVTGVLAGSIILRIQLEDDRRDAATEIVNLFIGAIDMEAAIDALMAESEPWDGWGRGHLAEDLDYLADNEVEDEAEYHRLRAEAAARLREEEVEGNEDGSNRDVPPFDNDPRTDAEIKQEVYDRYSDPDYDDDHPSDGEGW